MKKPYTLLVSIWDDKEETWVPNSEYSKRAIACIDACEGIDPEAVPELLEAAEYFLSTDNWLRADGDMWLCEFCTTIADSALAMVHDVGCPVAKAQAAISRARGY